MAEHIHHAKLVELEGIDHLPWFGNSDIALEEMQEFLTGVRPGPVRETTLATVLFVDIVGSTEKSSVMGDARWRDLLASFHYMVKQELGRFRGRLIDTAGDGVFASFDGPARAIQCACAIRNRSAAIGTPVRAGLHTGECEVIDGKIAGIAVHIGARVTGQAQPGEVIVSRTVKDLVAGSGLRFSDGTVHTLKGVPGEWRLFRVE
jgi:class 3 adenylate cyclase